jgi:ketosteroid isomerase-like protein
MSQENVEVVRRAIAALNAGDLDAWLAYYTADVWMRKSLSRIEGDYEGLGAMRRFFDDVGAARGAFQLSIDAREPNGETRVLASLRVTATGQASGIPFVSNRPTTDVYELVDGRIASVHTFLDRAAARRAVRLEG